MNKIKELWHRLTALQSTGDEARREYMTKVILVILNIAGLIFFITFIIAWLAGALPIVSVLLTVVIDTLLVASLWLAHHERWRLASYVPPVMFLFLAMQINYMEGVGAVAMLQYAIVIILATMLQGRRAQWGAWGICIIAYLAIGSLHARQLIPTPPVPEKEFARWAMPTIGMWTFITILQWFYTSQFQRALEDARVYAQEVTERERALEERNEEIQLLAEADRRAREKLERIVTEYVAFVNRVAQGNLRERLTVTAQSDLGDLGNQLNDMVNRLRKLTTRIITASEDVATASSEILAVTEQQAGSAREQVAATTQMTSTLTEIRTVAEEMSKRAQGTANTAERTAAVSQEGQAAVEDTMQGMQEIQARVKELAMTILGLSERTQQIEEIISTVDTIAVQSNMLALNAAVEAARAGEAGKGFEIVAQEVKSLADRSRGATARVRGIIQEIQNATDTAVSTTEEVGKSVTRGQMLTERSGRVILSLGERIEEAAQAALQILASAQQQVGGLEQLAQAMAEINETSQQTAGGLQQTEQTARNLHTLSQQMTQLVTQYRV